MGPFNSKHTRETRVDYFTSFREQGRPPKVGPSSLEENLLAARQQLETLDSTEETLVKMENVNRYPFSTVGKLQAFYEADASKQWSTGTLVRGDLVLTCAHNCYNRKLKSHAKDIWFTPSFSAESTEEHRIKVLKCFIPEKYQDPNIPDKIIDKNHDYAFLLLQKNIENKYGYVGIDFYSGLSEGSKFILGYPASGIECSIADNSTLHIFKGVLDPQDGLLHHSMETSAGMGGGPIIEIKNGEAFLVGLHSFGLRNAGEKGGIKLTGAIKSEFNEKMGKPECELTVDELLRKDKDFNAFVKEDWSRITKAKLNRNKIDTKRIKDLSRIDFFKLRELQLKGNMVDEVGIKELIKIQWENLQSLDLGDNSIKPRGVNELLEHQWINLTKLSLSNCELGDKGAKVFFVHNWQSLREVDLSRNAITEEGLAEIPASPSLGSLQVLNLSFNELQVEGVGNLVKGNLESLISLDLKSNHLQKGVTFLTQAKWRSLRVLKLGQNEIEDKDLRQFCRYEWLTLQELFLDSNRLHNEGVEQIIRTKWPSLKSINLQMNYVSPKNIEEYRGQLRRTLVGEGKVEM